MQPWQYRLLVTKDYSTCFGRFLRPPSGVLKTVVASVFNMKPLILIHPSTLYDTQHLFIRSFIIYSMTSGCYYSFQYS
jgi:hypothetical protein